MQKIVDYLKLNSIAVALALFSAILTMIANRSGVGWSWDTSDYVAVGKNFAAGNGLLDATGLPMTVRPPGLSILIGVGDMLGLSANSSARLLNALCAIVTVLGTSRLLQLANVKRAVLTVATALVAFSPALLWQYSMIWSEPPFVALLVLATIVALAPAGAKKFVLLVALFVALFFVRYVGPVFAVSIAVSAILFDHRKLGLIKATAANLSALAISLLPVWFWLQRNKAIDGTLTGARTPGGGSLLDPLKTFTATLGSWLTANPVEGSIYLSWNDYPNNTKILGVMLLIVFFALTAVYFFLFDARGVDQNKTLNVLLINVVTAIVYVAFSAYRFVHFELGPLDNRMMIPIFVPLVIVMALLIDLIKLASMLSRKGVLAIFAVFLIFQAISSIDDALRFGRDGRYWAAKEFQNQQIHEFVKDLPKDSSLMSNQPQQLFAVWQKSSVFNQYQLELAQTAECNHRYFVWYNSTYDDGSPNFEGQPEGASEIYSDESGAVLDLGSCTSSVATFWP